MWDCYECGTENIIIDKFCPNCFAPRPEEEVGKMAENDSKATDAPGPTEVAPDAENPASDAGSALGPAAATPSGPSEAVPSAGGFLTDWGR